jgi:hypothetical protein
MAQLEKPSSPRKVLKGPKEATVVEVNSATERMFLNRTQSGMVNSHPKFSGVYGAPLALNPPGDAVTPANPSD